MTKIFNVINGPIDSPLFIQLINNGVAIKSWYSHDDYKAYFAMCSKHHLIKDFTTLEAAYIERYEPDINHVYIEALFSENTQVIESLLKTKRLFLRENDKLSWRFASYCSKSNVTYDPNNGVTFTPLQAVFIVASESDSSDLVFIFETIKRLVKHDPDCVLQLDSMGNSVDYYLKKLQVSSRYKKEQMLIDQISEFITSAPYNNKILTFIYATFAYIPMDVIGVVFGFSMAIRPQKITKAYDELLSVTKSYRPVFPDLQHLIPSLDKDEVIHIFETLHKAQHYYSAFYLFCQANNIRHNEKDIDYSKDTLLAICNYIDRPISAVWILKIFDNIYLKYDKNNFSYHTYEKLLSHHDYLALCNKRHFIVGWEAVEKKFFTYFNLDINKAISAELDNNTFTNIPYLLKLKRAQINDRSYYRYSQKKITSLQELMLDATNVYSPKFTIELIEKLILYDSRLISELDGNGHNIYYYFTPLKNSKYATRDNHAKIKNISLLIEQEHRKQYQCSQRNMFFQKLDRYPLLPIADDMLHDDKLPSPV